MCRLFAYLGTPTQPDRLILQPEHSLQVQSYRPQETVTTTVNADGFGVGWYGQRGAEGSQSLAEPFVYKNMLPIWSDVNLPYLSRYIQSACFLSYVRSATPGQAASLTNCQPFGAIADMPESVRSLLFLHNGYIDQFRSSLYLPIRRTLSDDIYRCIYGSTDSEHIFALIADQYLKENNLKTAVQSGLDRLSELAQKHQVTVLANLTITNGSELVAVRHAVNATAPSLYYLKDASAFPDSLIVASEGLFSDHWYPFAEGELLYAHRNQSTNEISIAVTSL